MGGIISIDVNDSQVRKMMETALSRLVDTRPLMRIIAETIKSSAERNFAAGGRPNKWPLSARAKRDGGQTLSATGVLRRSLTPESGDTWAAVGTNKKYAAIHQFGGKTRPHVIRPRKDSGKKALRTPFGIFKKVRHPGSQMPARPFLMVQDEDLEEIRKTINDYLGL